MVGAAKDLARPAALGRRASAMPADVIKSPQLVFAIAAYQQRLAGNLGSEIVARLGGLLVSARYLPGAREHPLALRLVHRRIRVQCGRQSPGASDVGINREIRQTFTAHEAALYTPHFRLWEIPPACVIYNASRCSALSLILTRRFITSAGQRWRSSTPGWRRARTAAD